MISIAKFELRRRKPQVGTQQLSQNPPRSHEVTAIDWKNKAVRPRHLIGRKRGFEPGEHRRIAIERSPPQVHILCAQFEPGWSRDPFHRIGTGIHLL